jgi:hypothetical protein
MFSEALPMKMVLVEPHPAGVPQRELLQPTPPYDVQTVFHRFGLLHAPMA